jgi:predicted Zn-dependent protease
MTRFSIKNDEPSQDIGELHAVLERTVQHCEHRGAESEVYGVQKKEIMVSLERNDINLCTQQFISGIGIRTSIEDRLGFACCNSIDKRAALKTADKAMKMSKKTPPAGNKILFASPSKIPAIEGLFDQELPWFEATEAVNQAKKMVITTSEYPHISLDNGEFFVCAEKRAVCNSQGISLSECVGGFSWHLMVMAREGEEVGSYEYAYGCSTQKKAITVEETVRAAVKRALANLHAKKCAPFSGDIILGPEAVSTLLGDTIAFAANATNVHMGQSSLSGCEGKSIASSVLTVKDDSTLPYTYNSSSFDREGTPHQAVTIVKQGVLQQFLHHTQSAHQVHTESTGNATGSFAEMPRIDITHLIIEPSSTSLSKIIEETEEGLLVSRFTGSGEDISGAFSGGLKGSQRIQSGEITHPVKGITLQGNIFDILPNICAVSSETARYPHMTLPHVKIQSMQFVT